jgi:hypothetical protein
MDLLRFGWDGNVKEAFIGETCEEALIQET